MKDSLIKKNITSSLFKELLKIKKVISVTLVGSFVNQKDLTGISDIDTVVICKNLNEKLFNSCIEVVKNIDLKKCGLNNYSLKINPTFGPLKFDRSNIAVVHLMIYSVESHRQHVIKSPFTCFDWERSPIKKGYGLKEIFPVGLLQIRDFLEVRRSLGNYINDLENNVISYREYIFISGKTTEKNRNYNLDNRHKGEYTYHIIRNLISNYLKLCKNKNIHFSTNQIKAEIQRLFPNHGEHYANMFEKIYRIKCQKSEKFPELTIKFTKDFLNKFQQCIKKDWNNSIPIFFIRHYQTNCNNGTFLGQGRNPSINTSNTSYPQYQLGSKVYSSPMRRCIETIHELNKKTNIEIDDRLLEFNYGLAEGMDYNELITKHPEIIARWEKGEDPHFPNGENTQDVFTRLKSFLNDLKKSLDKNKNQNNISIITHNGILRCLLGNALGIKQKDWYKLIIPHGEPLEFLYYQNNFHPNIPRSLWNKVLKNIGYPSA